MGTNRVTVKNGDVNVRALLTALTHAKVANVGYPFESTGRVTHADADVPMATLAAWNELGTENVPPRPFMRQGAEILEQRRGLLVPHVKRLASGKIHADKFMAAVGAMLKGSIEAAVARGDFAPLSATTVAAKGSTEILVDSGQMLDSLDVQLSE